MTGDGTAAAVAWLMPFVVLCPTAAEQDLFLQRISERLGVGLDALRADLAARLPAGDPRRHAAPSRCGVDHDALREVIRPALVALRLGCPLTAIYALEDGVAGLLARPGMRDAA
jgi:hypothetical protein